MSVLAAECTASDFWLNILEGKAAHKSRERGSSVQNNAGVAARHQNSTCLVAAVHSGLLRLLWVEEKVVCLCLCATCCCDLKHFARSAAKWTKGLAETKRRSLTNTKAD